MKLLIICATCIAITLLSCKNESGHRIADNKSMSVNDAVLAGSQKYPLAKSADKTTSDEKNALAADTLAIATAPQNDLLQSGSPLNPDWDKKFIKTANIILELKDYKAYDASIHLKIRNFGAYIAQEDQNETDEQISNTINIKVPVDKFDELVNTLPVADAKVIGKNISTEDVTGEVVDTKARLEAKKQVRDRYIDLLKQAKNMNEILQVQNEIDAIQEDIESATGRVNYLTHSSAYSSITLRYYQFKSGAAQKEIEPRFINRLVDAFGNGANVIADVILFFISLWPIVLIAGITLFYFKRLNTKKA